MFEKEKQKLNIPILDFVRERVLDVNFKTRNGRTINKIESFNLLLIEIDEENSDIRKNVFVTKINSQLRILENWLDGTTSTFDLKLEVNKPLILVYNSDLEKYEIVNSAEVSLLDYSNNY